MNLDFLRKPSPLRNQARQMDLDFLFLLGCLALLGLGLVMIASASTEVSYKENGHTYYFITRQMIYFLIGVAAFLFAVQTPLSFWRRHVVIVAFLTLIGLVLVFVPGIGKEVNGAKRWLNFGLFNIQPSELAKIAAIMLLASYMANNNKALQEKYSAMLVPGAVLVIFALPIYLEPDFGSMAVLVVTLGLMLFLGGMRLSLVIGAGVLVLAAGVYLVGTESYRLDRIQNFTNPWADPYGKGYQLSQALIAYGRGDVFGLGLGNSIQKQHFLPEAHTDFIFSVLAEELGLIGTLLTIALFGFVVARAFLIGVWSEKARPNDKFPAYIAYGIASMWACQIAINIGVNIGVLPTKGLTLPFLSYGGSSLIACCLCIGLLLRIEWEHRTDLRYQDIQVIPTKEPVHG